MKFTLRILSLVMAIAQTFSYMTIAFAQENEIVIQEKTVISEDVSNNDKNATDNNNDSKQEEKTIENSKKTNDNSDYSINKDNQNKKEDTTNKKEQIESENPKKDIAEKAKEQDNNEPKDTKNIENSNKLGEDLEQDNQENIADIASNKYSVNVTLNIRSQMVPEYIVTIPDEIKFGTLSSSKETIRDYEIGVKVEDNCNGDIKLASELEGELTCEEHPNDRIPFKNKLIETSFISSKIITTKLIVNPKDVKNANPGDYTGTMQFKFSFVPDETINSDKCEVISPDNQNQLTVSNGLNNLADENNENQKTYFVIDYIDQSNPKHTEKYSEYFPNDYWNESFKNNEQGIKSINSAINEKVKNKYFYTLNVIKKDGEDKRVIPDIDNILEVRLPVNKNDNQKVYVARNHENKTESLLRLSNRPSKSEYQDGTYFEGADCVYIYSSKFSVYAVLVAEENKMNPEIPNPQPPQPPTPPIVPIPPIESGKLSNGKHTANVSLRKENDFNSLSMCNSLFAREADLKVEGKETRITLYIIDPIPNYSQYGTPLKNVYFEFDGKSYRAKVDSGDKEKRYYKAASGFIDTSGNYKSSRVTVTVPTEAVEESVNQKLKCTAFVNAVMQTTQSFYVVLDDFKKGQTKEEQGSNVQLYDNNYIAKLSMRKYDDINKKSMCDALFYSEADLKVEGKETELILYVIDPIPSYPQEGTPLSNIRFECDGKKYSATVTNDDKIIRHYQSASGFIEKEGDYKSTKITVTVPTSAIENSENGKLKCTAFVNAVMKTEQSFYVVLSNFKIGKTKNSVVTLTQQPLITQENPNVLPASNSLVNTPVKVQEISKLNTATDLQNNDNNYSDEQMHPKTCLPLKIMANSTALKFILIVVTIGLISFSGYWGYIYFRRNKLND